jgi:hypothetical protein
MGKGTAGEKSSRADKERTAVYAHERAMPAGIVNERREQSSRMYGGV